MNLNNSKSFQPRNLVPHHMTQISTPISNPQENIQNQQRNPRTTPLHTNLVPHTNPSGQQKSYSASPVCGHLVRENLVVALSSSCCSVVESAVVATQSANICAAGSVHTSPIPSSAPSDCGRMDALRPRKSNMFLPSLEPNLCDQKSALCLQTANQRPKKAQNQVQMSQKTLTASTNHPDNLANKQEVVESKSSYGTIFGHNGLKQSQEVAAAKSEEKEVSPVKAPLIQIQTYDSPKKPSFGKQVPMDSKPKPSDSVASKIRPLKWFQESLKQTLLAKTKDRQQAICKRSAVLISTTTHKTRIINRRYEKVGGFGGKKRNKLASAVRKLKLRKMKWKGGMSGERTILSAGPTRSSLSQSNAEGGAAEEACSSNMDIDWLAADIDIDSRSAKNIKDSSQNNNYAHQEEENLGLNASPSNIKCQPDDICCDEEQSMDSFFHTRKEDPSLSRVGVQKVANEEAVEAGQQYYQARWMQNLHAASSIKKKCPASPALNQQSSSFSLQIEAQKSSSHQGQQAQTQHGHHSGENHYDCSLVADLSQDIGEWDLTYADGEALSCSGSEGLNNQLGALSNASEQDCVQTPKNCQPILNSSSPGVHSHQSAVSSNSVCSPDGSISTPNNGNGVAVAVAVSSNQCSSKASSPPRHHHHYRAGHHYQHMSHHSSSVHHSHGQHQMSHQHASNSLTNPNQQTNPSNNLQTSCSSSHAHAHAHTNHHSNSKAGDCEEEEQLFELQAQLAVQHVLRENIRQVRNIPDYTMVRDLNKKALSYPILPPQRRKMCGRPQFEYTLVLDMDETLVRCSHRPFKHAQASFNLSYPALIHSALRSPGDMDRSQSHHQNTHPQPNSSDFYDESKLQFFVAFRPFLRDFLKEAARNFEVVLFTASEQSYAEACIKLIDPNNEFFTHKLFRQHCLQIPHSNMMVKDLSLLGRDLRKTIIVDNSIHAFTYQLTNGIPIPSYFGQKQDQELQMLINLLKFIATPQDTPELQSASTEFSSALDTESEAQQSQSRGGGSAQQIHDVRIKIDSLFQLRKLIYDQKEEESATVAPNPPSTPQQQHEQKQLVQQGEEEQQDQSGSRQKAEATQNVSGEDMGSAPKTLPPVNNDPAANTTLQVGNPNQAPLL